MTPEDPAAPSSRTPAFRAVGHAAVLIEGPPRVAVDPWRWREDRVRADLVLVTHGHADHCSEEDADAAAAPEAPVVCPLPLAARLERTFPGRVVPLAEGDERVLAGAAVRALPAEGPSRAAGFHPRGDGLAYLVTVAGARFLLLGDSTCLPEHRGLAPDVAFLAVGGFTVMTPDEAADAVLRIAPRLAVPVHWGDLSARFDAARRFVELCRERGVEATTGHDG